MTERSPLEESRAAADRMQEAAAEAFRRRGRPAPPEPAPVDPVTKVFAEAGVNPAFAPIMAVLNPESPINEQTIKDFLAEHGISAEDAAPPFVDPERHAPGKPPRHLGIGEPG